MGGKTAIAAGLLAGVAAGVLALAAILVLAPAPAAPDVVTAAPSASRAPASPSPVASSSPTPVPSPSASGAGAAFGVGEPAPSLSVAQLGGGTIDLAALRGKPVWVNFMATWCPSCRDELPLMNGYAARYADAGLVVVAVDVREDESTADAFAKVVGVTFPVGLDVDGKAQQAWGAWALPVHFWVDKDGVVRNGALGGIGPDVMAEGLKTILPGVSVTP